MVVFAAVVFSQIKKKVRSGDREGAVALARRWRRVHPRSPNACYLEYWALNGDRKTQPGENIDLLRRSYNLAPNRMTTAVAQLVGQLIRMYAKWGREQYAAEAERILDHVHAVWRESPWELECRADLALLRGERERERALRQRAWELEPRKDDPNALMVKAIAHADDGDPDTAKELLVRAAADKRAKALIHLYLAALVENEDAELAARHRAEAESRWRNSAEMLKDELEFCRRRLYEGPFADLRAAY